jgi:hypothetical protein
MIIARRGVPYRGGYFNPSTRPDKVLVTTFFGFPTPCVPEEMSYFRLVRKT